jgi:uncharacterized protein (DUF2236 family)
VLLQIAHPLIMAGVERYSQFQSDPLVRFLRTLEFMDTLVFGDRPAVRRALGEFNRTHDRVRGRLPEGMGRHERGTPYSGRDPGLGLWVFATLVDSSLRAYERFVAQMSTQERREFYRHSRAIGQAMGIPAEMLPPSLGAFRRYIGAMLESDALALTDASRRLARHVLYPQVGLIPGLSAALMRLATAGMLPERLRQGFGLPWSPSRQLMLDAFSAFTRAVRPFAPGWMWRSPLQGGRLAAFLLQAL